jgi:hypothetical protein
MEVTPIPLAERVYEPSTARWLRRGAALGLVVYLSIPVALVLEPRVALRTLWFLCIPLAPMFLLVAPNAWVSLCPLSSLQQIGSRLPWARSARLSRATSQRLQLVGWTLMFLGIPTRHLVFNTSGEGLLAATTAVSLGALGAGFLFLSLSGWCMGACPIRPVEVIYGQLALDRNRPTKCTPCPGCVAPCVRTGPDEIGRAELAKSAVLTQLVYGFPGFVAAYFALDLLGWCTREEGYFTGRPRAPLGIGEAARVYAAMGLGFLATLVLFRLIGRLGVPEATRMRGAAVLAYACYYLGVAPEITSAWQIDPRWSWALLAVALGVLMVALRRQRGAAVV